MVRRISMVGLFVHDHRFPKKNSNYYYSYGFDEEFFNRYTTLLGSLEIVGRETENSNFTFENTTLVNENIKFTTIKDLKELKNKNVRKKIEERIINSDYIVVRLPSILGLYAVKLAKKHNKPYLIEVVGCAWDAIANKGRMHVPIALIMMHLMKTAIKSSKYVVYVTEKFLQNRYPTKGKAIACSNVTLERVDSIDLEKRIEKIKRMSSSKKITLGTCATIDVIYKGQEDVIEAISILKQEGYEIEYQLVGGGSQEYLRSVAENFSVSDNIRFIGTLKHGEVFKWLEEIDIYIHPSKQEGLSRAIIEAMSKACPILAADAGGIHEQIERSFIFAKGNVVNICEIIRDLNKDKMIDQAIKNQESSKRYLKDLLYTRRANFFKKYIEEN